MSQNYNPLNNDYVSRCVCHFVPKPSSRCETTYGIDDGLDLLRSSTRNEDLGSSGTDILVNSLVEDTVEGLSALFTSHLSSLVSRLERGLLHRSVAHRDSPTTYSTGPLKISPQ